SRASAHEHPACRTPLSSGGAPRLPLGAHPGTPAGEDEEPTTQEHEDRADTGEPRRRRTRPWEPAPARLGIGRELERDRAALGEEALSGSPEEIAAHRIGVTVEDAEPWRVHPAPHGEWCLPTAGFIGNGEGHGTVDGQCSPGVARATEH